jgi:hypothetical protein
VAKQSKIYLDKQTHISSLAIAQIARNPNLYPVHISSTLNYNNSTTYLVQTIARIHQQPDKNTAIRPFP